MLRTSPTSSCAVGSLAPASPPAAAAAVTAHTPQVSQIKSTVHELLALFKDNRLYMGGDCGDTAMVVLTQRSDIQGVTEVREACPRRMLQGTAAPLHVQLPAGLTCHLLD